MSQNRSTRDDASGDGAGLGDDQGTRVGAPDQSANVPKRHSDTPPARAERRTGSGSEATEGMDDAEQGGAKRLPEGGDQHRSGYGGAGGAPKTSSDTREPPHDR